MVRKESCSSGRRRVSLLTESTFTTRTHLRTQDMVNVTWENLNVTVHGDHQVLYNLHGFANANEILALMGPSGSGKTTLLDALAGRLSKSAVSSGRILLNGKAKKLSYGTAAYVTQEDVFIGTLTVKETVMFSADLRLPDKMSKKEKMERVDTALSEMGLQALANSSVGNWHMRGISGGEKRRLSIAVEILTRPRLLFLDEPTSGLDSASSYFVMRTISNLAKQGRTVIASVHQPGPEVFELFDNLFLLSGGRSVYYGPATRAQDLFAMAELPCPSDRNPSDHFLRCINADFDEVNKALREEGIDEDDTGNSSAYSLNIQETVHRLVRTYEESSFAEETRRQIDEICSRQVEPEIFLSQASLSSFWKQFVTLTRRSFTNMLRDYGYYWLRLAMYVVLALIIGYIFHGLGHEYSDIYGRAACISFVVGFLTFMSIGVFPSFVEEMKVMTRERMNGHYGIVPYTMANFVSASPFVLLIAVFSSFPGYFIPNLHPGFEHWLYYVLVLFVSLSVVESLMMVVAAIVPNFLMGIITGAGIMGLLLLVSGFYRLPDNIPIVITKIPLFYMNFFMYSLQGMYKNEFIGQTFVNNEDGGDGAVVRGKHVIQSMYNVTSGRSKWLDLGIMVSMIFVYRTIFVLLMKFFEIVWPSIQAWYGRIQYKREQNMKRWNAEKQAILLANASRRRESRRSSVQIIVKNDNHPNGSTSSSENISPKPANHNDVFFQKVVPGFVRAAETCEIVQEMEKYDIVVETEKSEIVSEMKNGTVEK